MKRVFLAVVMIFILFGCSGTSTNIFDGEEFSKNIKKEFPEIKTSVLSNGKEDALLGKDGYYTDKILFYNEDEEVVLNVEVFDNEIDLENRSNYITGVIEKSVDILYNDMEFKTGGIANKDALASLFRDIPFIEEEHIKIGPLLIRIPEYVENSKSYVDHIEQYVSNEKIDFLNESKKHYDVEEKLNEIEPDIKPGLLTSLDSAYEELSAISEKDIQKITEKNPEDSVAYYYDVILKEVFLDIPYFKELFLEDENYSEIHKHLEFSNQEIEKEREKEREKEARERESQKEKKTKEYMEELSKTLNENGAPESEYLVSLEKWEGKEVIKIEHFLVDRDLKLALSLNMVEGSFKEETHYMLENLRRMISTTVETNPTDKDIVYMIINPNNEDLIIYGNYEGIEVHNEFQE